MYGEGIEPGRLGDSRAGSAALREGGVMFFDYQARWLGDGSRFKIGLWARQTGKDYTCAAEAVHDSMNHPKTLWVMVAAGERQARESLAKAREFAERLDLRVESYEEEPVSRGRNARLKAAEILWSNGSRLLALPGKPETVRGYSANVVLTEFAFHEDPEGIWRAVYPSISNPLRGGVKKLRIITTPNGRGNFFHHLWENSEFSKHRLNIHEAVRAGLPLDPEELRRNLNDPEAWAQEYECEFMDNSSILLPYEVIEGCESGEAGEAATVEGLSRRRGPFFAGIDFGRKQDLTVCWLLERVPWASIEDGAPPPAAGPASAGPWRWVTREVLALRGLSTPEQLTALIPKVARAERICLDYTGAGVGLGDALVKQFREFKPGKHLLGKVELCHFTSALKMELFPRLRSAFEHREVLIPRSRDIREDLHGVHRIISRDGGVSYRASRNADGHSDRATALALALRATTLQGGSSGVTIIPARRRYR